MVHAELVQAVTDACVKALNAGFAREDAAAVLARVQELLEQEDE